MLNNKNKKMATYVNMATGVEINLTEEDFKCLQKEVKFVRDLEEAKAPITKPAENDIHQMNKVSLLAHAKELGLQASMKMSVGKLKEAIEDHLNLTEEDNEIQEI